MVGWRLNSLVHNAARISCRFHWALVVRVDAGQDTSSGHGHDPNVALLAPFATTVVAVILH
jgi:hypothetical protein